MGFFSWITQDTLETIPNIHQGIHPVISVTMTDNEENSWTENEYDGYGEFGGKDYYELLAEMNGLTTRDEGIDLAFSGKSYLSPNLNASSKSEWVDKEPCSCPHQGYFYD